MHGAEDHIEIWNPQRFQSLLAPIVDVEGQYERLAAQHLKDDTAGAQAEAARYMQRAYTADGSAPAATATASGNPAQAPAPTGDAAADKQPVLKKRPENN